MASPAFRRPERLLANLRMMADGMASNKTLKVGFLETAIYPIGDKAGRDGEHVAQIAFDNEYGTSRNGVTIPARPFFRIMIDRESSGWGVLTSRYLRRTHFNVDQSLGLLGEKIKDQLQEQIRDYPNPPPNAPRTIEEKGFDKPLTYTGLMLASPEWVIAE